jgi:N-acetylglucosamine kinase-like BadF-type ATPase
METFLGIDGGGSRTRALLVDAQGKQLYYNEAGPTNPNLVDEKTLRETLRCLLDHCISTAPSRPKSTCFGLAGIGAPETARSLELIIQAFRLEKHILVSDAEIALEAAFPDGPGVLLIAGTGSICIGRDDDGKIARSGGWGWLADDGGSAAWIGQRAVESSVRQHDGRTKGAALKDAVFQAFDIRSGEDISGRLHRPTLTRSQLGGLAPRVIDLAEQGDQTSAEIITAAIQELAGLVHATHRRLSSENACIAFSGGLLENNPALADALRNALGGYDVREIKTKPVDGAVAIAMRSVRSR